MRIGEIVHYHPIIGEKHNGEAYRVTQFGDIPSCKDVVWLKGKAGCVCLSAVSIVTVGDLYELAGYPVPDGYELYYCWRHHGGETICARKNNTSVDAQPLILSQVQDSNLWQWKEAVCGPGVMISRTPASDCLDILPNCIKQKVTPV